MADNDDTHDPFDAILVRDNTHEVSGIAVKRTVIAEPGGELTQELSYLNKKKAPMLKVPETFRIKGSADAPLKTLDQHWKYLKREFDDIAEQAAYYYFAKKGSQNPAAMDEFAKHTLITLSGRLLNQDLDDELDNGTVDKSEYPIAHISNRLDAMRHVAESAGIKLDRFEKLIDALGTRTYEAADHLEHVLAGGRDDELEYAGGNPEGKDGEPFGGKGYSLVDEKDYNPDDWEELSEEEMNSPSHDDDDEDSPEPWKASLGIDENQPWADDDFDPDDERDERIADLMDDYVDYMVDFTNLANQIWMNAVTRITDGTNPQADPQQIQELKDLMKDTKIAYGRFKQASLELGASSYELQPIYDMLEDPSKGTLARMQKITSLASRPAMLEIEVKKALPREREK